MNEISSRMLFLGGLAVLAGAAVILILFLIVFLMGKIKLNMKLDMEYGENTKKKRNNSKGR